MSQEDEISSTTKDHRINYSKFDRELGDTLNIDGVKWRVGIIGDTKNEVIIALNDIIKEIKAITRKANKIENRKVFNSLFKNLNLERYI